MGVISIIPAEPHSGESRNPKLTTAENHSFRDYGFRFRAELVIGHFNPSPLGASRNLQDYTAFRPNRLCRCTMNAMANIGVARLTIGIETKAAMNRPPT